MVWEYKVQDLIIPAYYKTLDQFGIKKSFTVVDYGCGPGRYLEKAADLVGMDGRVYALDISEVALQYAKRRIDTYGIKNVILMRITEGRSNIPDKVADVVYALDMFHAVKEPLPMLEDIYRFIKGSGWLILEDGHQSRATTKEKVSRSELWKVESETSSNIKYLPITN